MGLKLYDGSSEPGEIRQYWFHCLGCKCAHAFTVGPQKDGWGMARWTFNGDFEKPSFSPSLLCNQSDPKSRCHSWVTNGQIKFFEDSYHWLKGQTLDIPDWDDDGLFGNETADS